MNLDCLERKEKGGNWRCRGPEWATAHFQVSVSTENPDLGSRSGFSCRDMVLRLGARLGLGPHNRHTRAAGIRARQSLLALCRDKDLCSATLFPSQMGGLGRDRDFSALCRDRNPMSQ